MDDWDEISEWDTQRVIAKKFLQDTLNWTQQKVKEQGLNWAVLFGLPRCWGGKYYICTHQTASGDPDWNGFSPVS